MRILRVIASMDPKKGGPCQGIRYSIAEMAKKNILNDVVCLDNQSEQYLTNKLDPFKIYALGPSKSAWQFNPRLASWLEQNIATYDAVVVHGLWLYSGFAAYRAVKKLRSSKGKLKNLGTGIKFFVMPHGMLDPYFQEAGSRKLKAVRNVVYWHLLEARIIHFADAVFFTSESELELARQTFGNYRPKKEINIGYGIPSPPLENIDYVGIFRSSVNGLGGRPYIVFLSRIHEKKGIDLLIEAYKYVVEKSAKPTMLQQPELPCLVIAGPGWDEEYGKLIKERLDSDTWYKNNVFTVGMVSGQVKWGALMGAEAFVLPSHQENFGIAVVEAMACHTPVLITQKVNIWQEIEAAGAGIVSNDTYEGTVHLLQQWFSLNMADKTKMADAAYECFLAKYQIAKPTENLLAAIKG